MSKRYLVVMSLFIFLAGAGFGAGFELGLFLFQGETGAVKIEERAIADETVQCDFCSVKQKAHGGDSLEVDLTAKRALLYEDGKAVKSFGLAYQSPEGVWYEAPTGYFNVGEKREKFLSSLFPVVMPFALQYYEDFFIHGIPYYPDGGGQVLSDFTGGCLRFQDEDAGQIFDSVSPGERVVVYKTFGDLKIKDEFYPPVDLGNFWLRQRFNNPLRNSRIFGSLINYLKYDYYQHTGADFSPDSGDVSGGVFAVYGGTVAKIQLNDGKDHGFGNAVILEHEINGEKIYSLYGHLSSIGQMIQEGGVVWKGEYMGEVGNSGFGCENYWKIGKDGCSESGENDAHLHFEIKKSPVLENPEGGAACETSDINPAPCYGYTPDNPEKYGYLDPMKFIFEKNNIQ